MPKLEERESRTKYFFISNSGRRMQKFSGDNVSDSEIREFEIPAHLIEQPFKNKNK